MNKSEIITELEKSPANVSYKRLSIICDCFFGDPRQKGVSHRVYKTPRKGDPRRNIQRRGNKAKIYQVKQVIKALKRLQRDRV